MQLALRVASVPGAGCESLRAPCVTGGSAAELWCGLLVPLCGSAVHKMELLTLTHGCCAPLPVTAAFSALVGRCECWKQGAVPAELRTMARPRAAPAAGTSARCVTRGVTPATALAVLS